MKIDKYTDQQLVKEYLKQCRDEEEHPEKYDEPGDMPSYYLYEEIVRRGIADTIPLEDDPKTFCVAVDWKDIDGMAAAFKKAIEKVFGGKVYNLPSCQGSDTYGFIISDQKLTRKQIKEIDGIG